MSLVALLLATLLQGNVKRPHIQAAVQAFQQGKAAQAKRQFDQAISFFEKAITIEPTFVDVRKALIRVNLDSGHRLEAAKALTQLLEIEPDNAGEHLRLAQLLLEQQQSERALAQFSAALGLEPGNVDALLGFATTAARLNMQDRATEALDRGRKLYPADKRFSRIN